MSKICSTVSFYVTDGETDRQTETTLHTRRAAKHSPQCLGLKEIIIIAANSIAQSTEAEQVSTANADGPVRRAASRPSLCARSSMLSVINRRRSSVDC